MKKYIIIFLIVAQLSFSLSFLLVPKPAEAFFVDFSFIIKDWPRKLENIFAGAAMRIAQEYANKYLIRFVDKLEDKFKIRDFLYYDKYLSDYYLSNLIINNIDDPDLREAFDIYYRMTVTGQERDPYGGVALLPQIKKKISDVYVKRGGTDPNKIYNPSSGTSDREYFATVQAYYSNPPSYTEENLRADFGAFQSEATTASQLEIMVGNGSKAGRVLTGSCKAPDDLDEADIFYAVSGANNPKDPVACSKAGGTWQRGALDQARDFIDNPTAKINNFMENAIESIFNINYDPKNPYTRIGAALGGYIFNQLLLDNDDDVFNEVPYSYSGDDGANPNYTDIDIDADGIPDGQDIDGNGLLDSVTDTCYHGGTPNVSPGCKKSSLVSGSPYFSTFCQAIDRTIKDLETYVQFITRNSNQVVGDNFVNEADADVWASKTLNLFGSIDGLIDQIQGINIDQLREAEISISRYQSYLDKVTESLNKDQDLDLARVGNGGGGIANLITNSQKMLDYIKSVKAAINKCDNPNFDAIGSIPAPLIEIFDPNNPPGGGPQLPPGPWSVSGKVFTDNNLNGLFDAGDVPTVGNRVYLETPEGQSYTTAVSDAQGNYSFTNFGDGQYRVALDIESWPAGTIETTDRSHPFTVGPDHVWNFGYKKP